MKNILVALLAMFIVGAAVEPASAMQLNSSRQVTMAKKSDQVAKHKKHKKHRKHRKHRKHHA